MAPGKGQGKGETAAKTGGGGDEFTMAAVAGAAEGAQSSAPPGPNDGGFGKMSQEVQYQLMEAAGLRPGPNVSLALAVDKFRREKMREVLLYLLFLFLFTTSTYLQRDVHPAHMYLQVTLIKWMHVCTIWLPGHVTSRGEGCAPHPAHVHSSRRQRRKSANAAHVYACAHDFFRN